MLVILTVLAYFGVLYLVSRLTSVHATNNTFYHADGKSPWGMVAFGMIGATISGVSFVSVPGMVIGQNMFYIQTCLGFIVGYFVIAFVLLPIYYKINLTTIYSYLLKRLGQRSYFRPDRRSGQVLCSMHHTSTFRSRCLRRTVCRYRSCVDVADMVVYTQRRH